MTDGRGTRLWPDPDDSHSWSTSWAVELRRVDHRSHLRCVSVLRIPGQYAPGKATISTNESSTIAQEFKRTRVDLSDDPIAVQRLKEAAEEAKIELSELKETQSWSKRSR